MLRGKSGGGACAVREADISLQFFRVVQRGDEEDTARTFSLPQRRPLLRPDPLFC